MCFGRWVSAEISLFVYCFVLLENQNEILDVDYVILRSISMLDAPGIVCKFLKPLLIIMFFISLVRFVILWSSILYFLLLRRVSNAIFLFFTIKSQIDKELRADTSNDRSTAIKEIK